MSKSLFVNWIRYGRFLQAFLLVMVLGACGVTPAERNNAGNDLSRSGNYDAAISAYQVAQVAEPDNAVIYFNLGSSLAESGDVTGAEAAFQQAVARGDISLAADAWYNLGNLYFSVGDIQGAIAAYREALRLNPSHGDARYNLEIANAQEIPPTPTAIEMQSELNNQQVNPSQTPTPNPAGQELPTPTPTPPDVLPPVGPSPENIGDDDEGAMTNEEQDNQDVRPEGELDVETATDMLEPIEASQDRISTFRDNYNPTGEQDTEYDW